MTQRDRKEYQKEWRARNKERTRQLLRSWREGNRERQRDINTRWGVRNPEKNLVAKSKHSAKVRGIEHTIEESDICIPDVCPVLGIPLMFVGDRRSAPSIDRIDSGKGYVPGNVVVVSARANILKNNATLEELKALVAFYERLSTQQQEHK